MINPLMPCKPFVGGTLKNPEFILSVKMESEELVDENTNFHESLWLSFEMEFQIRYSPLENSFTSHLDSHLVISDIEIYNKVFDWLHIKFKEISWPGPVLNSIRI